MTDPFDDLREPAVPLAPRSRIRTRSAAPSRRRARTRPGGQHHADTRSPRIHARPLARAHAVPRAPTIPRAPSSGTPKCSVRKLLDDPIVMPDGRIGHAEMRVGDSVFMLAGEFPEEQHLSPKTVGGSTVGLMLHVPNSDATYAKAVEFGATPLRPIASKYGARQGTIRDPFGHRWFVATALEADDVPVEDVPGRRFGDVGYMTLEVPDGERAARFFGELFGWELHGGWPTGRVPHRVDHAAVGHRHVGEGIDPDVRLYFRVDDIEAVAATRARPRRPSASKSTKTTAAATPNASTTKACASTSSAPSPATNPRRSRRLRGGVFRPSQTPDHREAVTPGSCPRGGAS